MLLSAVSLKFSLVLDPRGRLGGLGRKVVSACEDNEGGIVWVNVSESSRDGLPGLSQTKAR